jgi:hypothetical protein
LRNGSWYISAFNICGYEMQQRRQKSQFEDVAITDKKSTLLGVTAVASHFAPQLTNATELTLA